MCQLGQLHVRTAHSLSHGAAAAGLSSKAAVLSPQPRLLQPLRALSGLHQLTATTFQHETVWLREQHHQACGSTRSGAASIRHLPGLAPVLLQASALSFNPHSCSQRTRHTAAAAAAGGGLYETGEAYSEPGAAVTAVLEQQQQQEQQLDPLTQLQQQEREQLQPQQYSPLHYDIQKFAKQIVPTQAEKAEKQRVIQSVAVATKRSFEDAGGIKLQPFGSFVNGLSTWNSDIDLVVTGLVKPSSVTGGFAGEDKRLVYRALERIAAQLRRYNKVPIKKMIIIRTARIPIIKLETSTRVTADISLGDTSGPKAARYIAQQVSAYPPLGPLTLVLKVFLRSCGLNEVANGGLSSFSLTNMVLAHIMQELQEGRDMYDLGEALYGFLVRFGDEFDIRRDAVSVAAGGCVPRSELMHLSGGDAGGGLGGERLILEDPLTGRDVASGTYRITAIQAAFRRAARRLEQLAGEHHNGSSSSSGSSGSSKQRVNYLEGLFNVQRALSREAQGHKGGRSAAKNLGLLEGGGVLAGEYYVLGRGGRYKDYDDSSYSADDSLEYPLDGDEYGDELEALLYNERTNSSSRRSQRKRRRSS